MAEFFLSRLCFLKTFKLRNLKFDFLHVCLKVDTVRYRCRMNVIESALERAGPRVCDHKIVR